MLQIRNGNLLVVVPEFWGLSRGGSRATIKGGGEHGQREVWNTVKGGWGTRSKGVGNTVKIDGAHEDLC